MCMIASPDCSLTPRRGRKCPSPFQEETDLDITNTLGDDFGNIVVCPPTPRKQKEDGGQNNSDEAGRMSVISQG